MWGNNGSAATTTTRWMNGGFGDTSARTTEIQFACPFSGILRNMYVHVNGTAGNGNAIVYTLRIAAANTALTVSLASTSADGNDTAHSVAVNKGALLSLQLEKAASIATQITDFYVTCELIRTGG